MTNAEKYLKDGVDEDEFVKELHYFWWANEYDVCEGIRKFLKVEAKPTLTEDEKVILRNLRYEKGAYEYTKIGRTDLDSEGNCDLILIDSDDESVWWGEYGHLFQFIKERRRI